MRHIPLIDISRTATYVREIEKASRQVGFMYVAGHGIAPATVQRVRAAVIDYFAQPLDVKLRDRISRGNYRGYIPLGFFSPNTGGENRDHYEGYKLHFDVPADDPVCAACDLYGPNKWPRKPAHFRESLLDYWRQCDRVATMLLAAFARILGVPRDDFLRCFIKPLTNMTLLHYPPQEPGSGGFGIHPHKDTDALTILAPDPVGGLMIRCRGKREWIRADPPPDALIVNIGDLLELWSGGCFVSTPHKVENRGGAERYSFPYFCVPRHDTVVRPLRPPQPGFDRASVHVGNASRNVWRSNWHDAKLDDSSVDLVAAEH